METEPIIEITGVKNYLGGDWVHDDLDLTINRGEVVGIVGGSGTGKTTLLRSILMLQVPNAGSIKIFGTEILDCSAQQAIDIQHRWGVMFQQSALFSSLTVLENVMFPLTEFTKLTFEAKEELALINIALAGLPTEAAVKYPAELSGGMQKRAALARAIVLDPELLFLDEPTAGLDPNGADAFDDLVLTLRDTLDLTIVLVTHDLDTLWRVTDKVAFLGDGKVLATTSMEDLVKQPHPLIHDFFASYRGELRMVSSPAKD